MVVRVLGAGPAGSAAALSALHRGAEVEIFEKTPFPRHKVCGEFLSPECIAVLERLGVWNTLLESKPARITRLQLRFGNRESSGALPEPAWGVSRYLLDNTLLDHAIRGGAVLHRAKGEINTAGPTVVATGRHAVAPKGRRLFGFKAHFDGPPSDAMELYFLKGLSYVGVNAAEGGITNVCGLAGEEVLSRFGFDIDAYLGAQPAIRERLRGLRRSWKWLTVGPLTFGRSDKPYQSGSTYYAGDCLSFVDPFTGSGILSALLIGRVAGQTAGLREPINDYKMACMAVMSSQSRLSAIFRNALEAGWGYYLGGFVPAFWLFRATRPKRLNKQYK
jgi:hypothetical protein